MMKTRLILSCILGAVLSQGWAAGFFKVEKTENDRWFFVDPAGERFFATGVDHVSFYVHRCAKRGGMPYHDGVLKQFGSEKAWAEDAARRMRSWGFNTVGISDKPGLMLQQGFAFPVFTAIGSAFALKSALKEPADWRNFPNVFDPRFEAGCLERARVACAPWRGNPNVIGYFIDNELQWGGRDPENSDLFADIMLLSAGNPAKIALRDFLHEKYTGDVNEFNRVWGTRLASWEDFTALNALHVPVEGHAIREAFLGVIADRYYRFTTAAIRAVDPDHLILGNRYAGTAIPDWVLQAAGKYCDVISVNAYPVIDRESGDLSAIAAEFDRIHRLTGRPLYLTEWSFPALDSGLPSTVGGGMRVDTQAQRAMCARWLQTLVFSLPYFVGSNYFMWVDQSPYGRPGFAEDCNYGLVREDDSAYSELTAMFAELNPAALAIHAGLQRDFVLTEVERRPGRVVGKIFHHGAESAEAEIRISGGGMEKLFRIALKPGSATSLECAFPGEAPVTVEILNSESVRGARRMSAATSGVWVENRSGEAFSGGGVAFGGEVVEVPPLPALALQPMSARPSREAAFRLTRNGCGFSYSNGALTVESGGTNGRLIDEIKFGDAGSAGWIAPMLQWRGDAEEWTKATHPGRMRLIREKPFVELEMVRGGGGTAAKQAWELTSRIILFADSPEVWIQPVSIRNVGSVPLRISGFLLQPHPASGQAQLGASSVPNYHRREQRNVWKNPDGTQLGAWSPNDSMTVRFWKDASGGFHPDAKAAVEGRPLLMPGECWRFPEKPMLAVSDGRSRGGNPVIVDFGSRERK